MDAALSKAAAAQLCSTCRQRDASQGAVPLRLQDISLHQTARFNLTLSPPVRNRTQVESAIQEAINASTAVSVRLAAFAPSSNSSSGSGAGAGSGSGSGSGAGLGCYIRGVPEFKTRLEQ